MCEIVMRFLCSVLKGSSLKKQANSSDSGLGEENASMPLPPSEWVRVPEFVPTRSCPDAHKISEAKGWLYEDKWCQHWI